MNNLPLKSGHNLEARLAPVTSERPCRIDTDKTIERPYLPRASVAPSFEQPDGSARHARKYPDYSVMQQHCVYWDMDEDDIIWPLDTWRGFRDLGFNVLFCFWATIVVHAALSIPTRIGVSYYPDPFFRIYIQTIHAAKHGSDSGAFDTEGRFVPSKFEDMWTKVTFTLYTRLFRFDVPNPNAHNRYVQYTKGPKGSAPRTSMTLSELWLFMHGNRLAMDPFGWAAGFLEWVTTFLLVQKDGLVDKEDVRRVIDGSIFFEIRDARRGKEGWNKGWGLGGDGFFGGDKMLPFGL